MRVLGLGAIGAALVGAIMLSGVASAAPLSVSGTATGPVQSDNLIEQVQNNRRGFGGGGGQRRAFSGGGQRRAFGGGGYPARGYARRGYGGGYGPAAVGLGVLGAAVAIGAAQSCWRRQPVLNPWNEIVGYRRVYVC